MKKSILILSILAVLLFPILSPADRPYNPLLAAHLGLTVKAANLLIDKMEKYDDIATCVSIAAIGLGGSGLISGGLIILVKKQVIKLGKKQAAIW